MLFLLGDSSASELYAPTFRNTLFHLHRSCEQEEGNKGKVVLVQFMKAYGRFDYSTYS